MPGSAKGVMFITIEDETGVANLVVWPRVFEASGVSCSRPACSAVAGRVQREGEVVHLVAEHLIDLSDVLRTVGERDERFRFRTAVATRPPGVAGLDERVPALGRRVQDIFIPDLYFESGLKVRARDFR